MKEYPLDNGFLLVLEKNEEIISSIASFAEKEKIGFTSISGIGSADNAVLAYFDTTKKSYVERVFEGDLEIVSISGNVCLAEEKPRVHLHCTISGNNYLANSGHLVSAKISVTCELVLTVFSKKISREMDERTGLMLIG